MLGSGHTAGFPAAVSIALYVASPTPVTAGTKASGGSYADLTGVTNNSTNWPNAVTLGSTVTKSNGTVFSFATPTGSWGVIVAFAVLDAGGTVICYGPVPPGVPTIGVPCKFAIGALQIIHQ